MNPKDAAKVLGMSYGSLINYLKAGVFPGAVKTRGTRWDIPDADLRAFKRGTLKAAGSYVESAIERRTVEFCESLNLRCIKGQDQRRKGFPDRFILGREGQVLFIEFKTEALSQHQKSWHAWLLRHFFDVLVIRNLAQAKKEIMQRVESGKL
jgi:hypothetical protein